MLLPAPCWSLRSRFAGRALLLVPIVAAAGVSGLGAQVQQASVVLQATATILPAPTDLGSLEAPTLASTADGDTLMLAVRTRGGSPSYVALRVRDDAGHDRALGVQRMVDGVAAFRVALQDGATPGTDVPLPGPSGFSGHSALERAARRVVYTVYYGLDGSR